MIAPGLFPHGFQDHSGQVGVYFEAGAVIVVLVLLGQILELQARERTGSAIRARLDLAAKTARIVRAGWARGGNRARVGSPRRQAARAPGREGPGRR